MNAMPSKQLFTVWEFRGLDGAKAIVAKVAEPNDRQVQHEYQRVIKQVWAYNKADAFAAC